MLIPEIEPHPDALTIEPRLAPVAQFMEEGIPFNQYLGLKCLHLVEGSCVLQIPWMDKLIGDPTRPAVHGGVTSMLIDTAGGAACFTRLDLPGERVSTVDLRVDYLRPGPPADLWVVARVVRLGNRVAVTRMEVYSGGLPPPGTPERAAPIAAGHGVYNVLRKDR